MTPGSTPTPPVHTSACSQALDVNQPCSSFYFEGQCPPLHGRPCSIHVQAKAGLRWLRSILPTQGLPIGTQRRMLNVLLPTRADGSHDDWLQLPETPEWPILGVLCRGCPSCHCITPRACLFSPSRSSLGDLALLRSRGQVKEKMVHESCQN